MIRLRILTAAFLCGFLLILFWADQGNMPALVARLYAFPMGDKAGHFFLMGGLSFLINLNIPDKSIRLQSKKIPAGILFLAAVVFFEELSQLFFQTRTFSILDLSFSLLGIAFFGYLGIWLFRKLADRGDGRCGEYHEFDER